jgi:hypothetical protein
MKKTWLKYAMLWHRFLGIGVCLFFGIWFVSGIVMMYARMPELSEADRLDHLPQLDLSSLHVSATIAVGAATPLERMTVGMLQGRPVYRVLNQAGEWSAIFADDGSQVPRLDPKAAIDVVSQFSGNTLDQLHWVEELKDVDQWTVYPASRPYLPFEVIAGDDAQATRYYVSAVTGSVYLTTTKRGRLLAWCGAIPHWWYIRALRANTPLWRIVMIVASGIGVIMSIAGIIAGVLRYSPSKRYRFPGPRNSSVPHTGMKRWHYVLGYSFGLVTFTWIFSGLASMDPGNWSPGPEASLSEKQAFAGGPLETRAFQAELPVGAAALMACLHPKELELILSDGKPYYLARQDSKTVRLLAGTPDANNVCLTQVSTEDVSAASSNLVTGSHVSDTALLTSYDAYYYDRHDIKPLPVLRVRLDDASKTVLYVNLRTGLIEARYTNRSRLERWLYNGLHSLDFPFLYHHRPLWDTTVIVLSIGGFLLSGSGIVLSFKYLRKSSKKRRQPLRPT